MKRRTGIGARTREGGAVRDIRIHVREALAGRDEVALPEQAARHVLRVLRLRSGSALTVFDGAGGEYAGRIERTAPRLVVRIERHIPTERESPLHLTLVQGVSRAERMDFAVQKAVELGVREIQPVLCARGVVRLDPSRATARQAHWQAVAIAACAQCGRNRVPPVHRALALGEWLERAPAGALRFMPNPGARTTLSDLRGTPDRVELLIGPEGGFEADEVRQAERSGFVSLSLGRRILRTETATLVAVAAMQWRFGDLDDAG